MTLCTAMYYRRRTTRGSSLWMQSAEEVKFYLSTLTKPITWRLEAGKT